MPSLKQQMINGLFWSAIEKYSGIIVSLIVSMVLARLIAPKDFGVIAIAMVLVQFLQMFCTIGIGPAIIQRKDLEKEDLDSIYTFSLFLGFLFSILFFFCSKIVATFYNEPQLVLVCQILTIMLFFAAANMVPNALMARDRRFKQIAKRTLLFQISSSIISIYVAYCGGGVYALLISPIITAVGIFIYNRHYYHLSILWKIKIDPLKRIFSFSFYQFLFEFINYFSRNLDKLIIGRSISAVSLGYYEKSYRLMQMPMTSLTSVINPVLQPVLSALQDETQTMALKYNQIIRFIATISFPLGITLSMCGNEIITVLYGNQWENSIKTFSILCLSVPMQLLLSTTGSIYQACNATKELFFVGIVNTIITVSGFIIAVYVWGTIESVASAWTITSVSNFVISYYVLYKRVMNSSLLKMYKELCLPFINLGLVILVLYYFSFISFDSKILSLLLKLALSSILSAVFVQLSGQYDLRPLLKSFKLKI